jgi:hypothetical protein
LIHTKKYSGNFVINEIEAVKLIGEKLELDLAPYGFDQLDPLKYDKAVILNSCDQGYGIFTMDDSTVFFFEKYLSDIFNDCNEFTKTHLLVVLDTLFKMMENGLYSVRKIKTIMAHYGQIKSGGFDDDSKN